MNTEAELELYYATRLAFNLGEGLKALKPASINAGIKLMGGVPLHFAGLREWSRALVEAMCRKHPKKIDLWGDPQAEFDVETYGARRVWEYKVNQGVFLNPMAGYLAAKTQISRFTRNQAHEAINHSIKHNENIAHLLMEMRDHLDQVLLGNFHEETRKIAAALVRLHPEMAEIIAAHTNPKGLSHDPA